jgi:hypothetical protein
MAQITGLQDELARMRDKVALLEQLDIELGRARDPMLPLQ